MFVHPNGNPSEYGINKSRLVEIVKHVVNKQIISDRSLQSKNFQSIFSFDSQTIIHLEEDDDEDESGSKIVDFSLEKNLSISSFLNFYKPKRYSDRLRDNYGSNFNGLEEDIQSKIMTPEELEHEKRENRRERERKDELTQRYRSSAFKLERRFSKDEGQERFTRDPGYEKAEKMAKEVKESSESRKHSSKKKNKGKEKKRSKSQSSSSSKSSQKVFKRERDPRKQFVDSKRSVSRSRFKKSHLLKKRSKSSSSKSSVSSKTIIWYFNSLVVKSRSSSIALERRRRFKSKHEYKKRTEKKDRSYRRSSRSREHDRKRRSRSSSANRKSDAKRHVNILFDTRGEQKR